MTEKTLGCGGVGSAKPIDIEKFEQQTADALEHLRKKEVLTGCTSYVQRMLQVGYVRAAAIMQCLEGDEIISEPDETGKRHWLT